MTKNITIYSTPSCTYCHMAKDFLKEKGIAFTDINVAGNQEMINELVEKSGQRGVPVIDIDGEILVGFDKSELESKLDL
jgi:glutaredoxin 3